MKTISIYGFISIILLMTAQDGFAGFTWSDESAPYGMPPARGTTFYLEQNKYRTEIWTETHGRRKVLLVNIFRGDKNVTWGIDAQSNQYTENTKKASQAYDIQSDQEEKQLEADEKGLKSNATPEQQAELEKSWDSRREPAAYIYKPTGMTWKVKIWNCRVYELWRNGEKDCDECMIEGDHIPPGFYDAIQSAHDVVRSFHAGSFSTAEDAKEQARVKVIGPLTFQLKRMVYGSDGQPFYIEEITEVKQEEIPSSLFELPKGAVKVEKLWGGTR